ncbi:MAG: type IV toxin-antitoxin system AbiEi family antitoxin domain-containing protein, partial [Mycobacteriaceae bacterium]
MSVPRKWPALEESARQQWGLVTMQQCYRLGVNRSNIMNLKRAGLLTVVIRGVYQITAINPVEHQIACAAWLVLGKDRWAYERRKMVRPDAVISHSTALHIQGVAKQLGKLPEITMPYGQTFMHNAVRRIETRNQPEWADVDLIDGLPVVSVPRSLVDLLMRKPAPPENSYIVGALLLAAGKGMSTDVLATMTADAVARFSYKKLDVRQFLAELLMRVGVEHNTLAGTILFDRWNQLLAVSQVREHTYQLINLALRNAQGDKSARKKLDKYVGRFASIAQRSIRKCDVIGCHRHVWAMGKCTMHAKYELRERTTSTTSDVQVKSGFGIFGVLEDDGEKVLCHECGLRFRQLTYGHLARHGMTTREYKI